MKTSPIQSNPIVSEYREEICLNGLWDFMPMENFEWEYPPKGQWAEEKIKVPSPWNTYPPEAGGKWRAYRNFDYPEYWNNYRNAWYQRKITLPDSMKDKLKQGYRLKLRFNAVMHQCILYLNGKRVGQNRDGYLPFEIDITETIYPEKENILNMVIKENQKDGWYYYAPPGSWYAWHHLGIWQDVFLKVIPPGHIDDVFVKTSVRNKKLNVDITLRNQSEKEQKYKIISVIKEKNQIIKQLPVASLTIPPKSSDTVKLDINWENPNLWSPESPYLYHLETQLISVDPVKETIVDSILTRFGFREFWIDGRYFILNGTRIKFKGDSWHYMGPVQQNEKYVRTWYQLLKETGGNAIRLHAMPYPSFYLDIADEMGVMIINECAVYGSAGNLALTEERFWENSREHVKRFVLRDRNHPSVMLWSASNEVVWRGGKDSFKHLLSLESTIHKFDPTRPISFDENDSDLGGQAKIYGGHYGTVEDWKRQNISTKPLMVNEFSGLYYNDCHETSYIGGEAVYESFDKRLEIAGEEARQMIWGLREIETASLTPWNIVWYSMYPQPNKKIFLKPEKLNTTGLKLDYINPYSVTLNYGFDTESPTWKPNPAYSKIKSAYPAIAAHITEMDKRFYAGDTVQRTFYIFNDIRENSNLTFHWSLKSGSKIIQSDTSSFKMSPYETKQQVINLRVPDINKKSNLQLEYQIKREKKIVYTDSVEYSVYPINKYSEERWKDTGKITLLDDYGKTREIFNRLQIQYTSITSVDDLSSNLEDILVIGAGSLTKVPLIEFIQSPLIQSFIDRGGTLICLENSFTNHSESQFNWIDKNVKYAHPCSLSHPILDGIDPRDFQLWRGDGIIARKLYLRPDTGNIISLMDVGERDLGMVYSPLLEVKYGKGTIFLNQLELIEKIGKEPIAEKLLLNMLQRKHQIMPPVKAVRLLSEADSSLSHFLKGIGLDYTFITTNKFNWLDSKQSIDSSILLIDGKSTTLVQKLKEKKENILGYLNNGGILFIQEATPETLSQYSSLLNINLTMEFNRTENVVKAKSSPFLEGLNNSDFCWANGGGGEDIIHYTIDCDKSTNMEPLLKTVPVRWAGYAGWAEQYKVGKMMKIISEFPGTKYPMIRIPMGKGQIIISQIKIDSSSIYRKRANRIMTSILTNLGADIKKDKNPLMSRQGSIVDEQGYIRAWLMLGPFKNDDTTTRLTQTYIPNEGWGQPKEGIEISGKKWKKYFSSTPNINLQDTTLFGIQENSAAYSHIYVYSPLRRDILLESPELIYLKAGSNDGMIIWLNAEVLIRDDRTGTHEFDRHVLGPVKLRKGWNRLLVKTSQYAGDWEFSARFVYKSGAPVTDLIYSLNPPD